MKVLLFLTVFYTVLVAYGMNASHAGRGGACSDDTCIEKELANTPADDDLIAQIQTLLETIETKISQEKLQSIIQSAADKNPQIADLLKIIQEYSVLTDITLETKENP